MNDTTSGPELTILRAEGPFSLLVDSDNPWIFDANEGRQHGIYIWSIRLNSAELIHYVGETGRSFRKRFSEHLIYYLSGQYLIYEAEAFRSGHRIPIWKEMRLNTNLRRAPEFMLNSSQLYSNLNLQLRSLRLWLIPTNVDRRQRCLIEGSIARALYDQSDPIGSFQEDGIVYQYRKSDEPQIHFKIVGPELFLGLDKTLTT